MGRVQEGEVIIVVVILAVALVLDCAMWWTQIERLRFRMRFLEAALEGVEKRTASPLTKRYGAHPCHETRCDGFGRHGCHDGDCLHPPATFKATPRSNECYLCKAPPGVPCWEERHKAVAE
jgi:hypothetical protein